MILNGGKPVVLVPVCPREGCMMKSLPSSSCVRTCSLALRVNIHQNWGDSDSVTHTRSISLWNAVSQSVCEKWKFGDFNLFLLILFFFFFFDDDDDCPTHAWNEIKCVVVGDVRCTLNAWNCCHRNFCNSYQKLHHMEIFCVKFTSYPNTPILSSSPSVQRSSAGWHKVPLTCYIF